MHVTGRPSLVCLHAPRGAALWSRNEVASFPDERAVARANFLGVVTRNRASCNHRSDVRTIRAVRSVLVDYKRSADDVPNLTGFAGV